MRMTEEIIIPVPWGHISGKLRGPVGGKVVLCLHGLQDNCGSFDRLLPLLPKGFQYVAIDLPGHGKSSHFQTGLPLVYLHFVFAVKLIVDFYKWDKLILLAHSFGAQMATIFAAIYPEYCEKLILLEGGITTHITNDRNLVKHLRRHFDEMQSVDRMLASKEPPSHTYEEALQRFMTSRFSSLTRESAEILIKRSLIKSGNGVRFSTDQRLKKLFRFPMNIEQLTSILNAVKCPCMLIIATETFNLYVGKIEKMVDVKKGNDNMQRMNVAKEKVNFIFKIVEGNHDVHLNNSALVAENIIPFLINTKSSL